MVNIWWTATFLVDKLSVRSLSVTWKNWLYFNTYIHADCKIYYFVDIIIIKLKHMVAYVSLQNMTRHIVVENNAKCMHITHQYNKVSLSLSLLLVVVDGKPNQFQCIHAFKDKITVLPFTDLISFLLFCYNF